MPSYQPITDKETNDLASLMENCYYAVSNAELFMETLSKDLSVLDGVSKKNTLYLNLFCSTLYKYEIKSFPSMF